MAGVPGKCDGHFDGLFGDLYCPAILANAFVGPAPEKQNPILKVLITVLLAMAVAAVILLLIKSAGFSDPVEVESRTASILFGSAGMAIVIAVTTIVVNRIQNRKDGE